MLIALFAAVEAVCPAGLRPAPPPSCRSCFTDYCPCPRRVCGEGMSSEGGVGVDACVNSEGRESGHVTALTSGDRVEGDCADGVREGIWSFRHAGALERQGEYR